MRPPTPEDTIERRGPDAPAQSRRDYADLINSINGIVWEVDARTMRFTFVSHQAETMLGYPVAAWLSDPDFWVDHMHPEDRGWAPAYCERETRKKSGHAFEYRMLAADGRTVWLRDIVSVVVEDDGPIALRGVMMDVTDRKLAEQALRASDQRLRQALRASRTGLWDWNTDTNQVSFSPEWMDQIGYGPGELEDTFETWRSRLHPDDHDRALAYVAANLTSRVGEYRQEFRLRHRDGTYRWIEAHASFVTEPDGRKVRMLGSHTDITDRKQAEEALNAAKSFLQQVVDTSPSMIFVKDGAGRVVFVNQSTAQYYGATPEQMISQSTEVVHLRAEEAAQFVRDDVEVIRTRRKIAKEEVNTAPDGTEHWFQTVKVPLLKPDGTAEVLGISTDITERKRAEEALRRSEANLAEAQRIAKLGSWEMDVSSRQLVWSEETYRIFEVVPTEFPGTHDAFLARVHPDDRALVRETYARAVESHTPYDLVHRLRMEDGRIKFVHERCETRYAEDGSPVQSIGTVQDITVRTLAETERDELAQRLLEAEESERRAIARDLHDEIGQSLTALKLSLQLAARAQDRAERLTDGVGIVDQILRQVRDLSLSLHSTALDDLGLECALRGHAEQETQRAGLALDVEMDKLPESLPHSVEIACFRITQEALTNVIRHARASRVLLRLRHTALGLELLVRDDGIGMAEPERVGSNSVGLAGMRERARLLGGAVRLAPAPGAGTDVVAILPLPGQITPSARSWSIRSDE